MNVLTTVAQVREWRRASGGSVGLVPTMGYLHAGHISLVERARAENHRVAASIFVNPTQFGPGEDLAGYPRDVERDRSLLVEAGCAAVFVPEVGEMFPPGATSLVDVGPVASPLEGERRPGHFRGVATVVLKLLGIFQPTRAYFGDKDAQQLAVVRRMVRDLEVPVEIVGCPTVREPDGLALSSRNSYLTPDQRRAAGVLYRALDGARRLLASGERRGDALRQSMHRTLEGEPLARPDYVSVADPDTFRELDDVAGPALLALAVFLGRARLIDNLRVDADQGAGSR